MSSAEETRSENVSETNTGNEIEFHCFYLYPITLSPVSWFRGHCNFAGPGQALKRHVLECHPKSYVLNESCSRKQYKGMETWYMMCLGELFWCCCFYRDDGDILFYNQLIGEVSRAHIRYKIVVKMSQKTSKKELEKPGLCGEYYYADNWEVLRKPSVILKQRDVSAFCKKHRIWRKSYVKYTFSIKTLKALE